MVRLHMKAVGPFAVALLAIANVASSLMTEPTIPQAPELQTRKLTTEIIVDDRDSGFQRFGDPQGWKESSSSDCTYNGHAYWAYCAERWYDDTTNDWAQWRPQLPYSGRYRISVFIPRVRTNRNDTTQANYQVFHAEGDTIVYVNQEPASCSWVELGTFRFNAGSAGYVELMDITDDWYYYSNSQRVRKTILFDAIKFTLLEASLSAPTLYVIDNADRDGNYTVRWSSVSAATGYILEEDGNSAFSSPMTVHTGSGTSTSFGSKSPGTYYYRVKATSGVQGSSWSNIESVTVSLAAPTLYPIDNSDGDGNYTLRWSSVSEATGYILEEDGNSAFSSPVTVYAGSGISTSLSGKSPGTYYYRVKATTGGWSSTWSNVQSVMVSLAAPTLHAIDNSDGDGNYTVCWSSVNAATGYILGEDVSASFSSQAIAYAGSGTCTSFNDKRPGTYYYRVQATAGGWGSPWSNAQSVTVNLLAPTLYAIENPNGDGNYTVSWSSVSGATRYKLQEDDNVNFHSPTVAYSGSARSRSFSNHSGGKYYYRVRAEASNFSSDWSASRWVIVATKAYLPMVFKNLVGLFVCTEPNDVRAQACGPLLSRQVIRSEISTGDPRDAYFLEVSGPSRIVVDLAGMQSGTDFHLSLHGAEGRAIAWSSNPGNTDEHIDHVASSAGRYYIQIYPNPDAHQPNMGPYILSVALSSITSDSSNETSKTQSETLGTTRLP